jgi:hypothetical protein
MISRNVMTTVLALAAGISATAIVGVAAKMQADNGAVSAFIMSTLFATVLFWLPIRAVVGLIGRWSKSTNG